MRPLKLHAAAVAKGLGVPATTVSSLIRGRRSISAELAMRLARYMGTSAEFWVGLQGQYDLDMAEDKIEDRIAREVQRCPLVPKAA